jgi:hypothetical protein
MKSRLAVSLLFMLIAATFTSDAIAAFERVRSWTGKISGHCGAQVCNRHTARDSALISAVKRIDQDEVTMIHLDGDRLAFNQDCATANQSCVVRTISTKGKTITLNSGNATKVVSSQEGNAQGIQFKLVGSHYHGEAFDFITTAARQIHELLSLMRIKS